MLYPPGSCEQTDGRGRVRRLTDCARNHFAHDGHNRVVTTVQHYAAVGSLTLSLDDGRELTLDLAAGDGSFYGFAERTRDGGAAG